jgi:hypothetical protein
MYGRCWVARVNGWGGVFQSAKIGGCEGKTPRRDKIIGNGIRNRKRGKVIGGGIR